LHFMKPLLIAVWIAGLLILPRASTAQTPCRVTVKVQIEVGPGKLSLADLLSGDTCPELTRAAAAVDLGHAPLAGSVRVLAGAEVRAYLQKLAGSEQNSSAWREAMAIRIPEMFIPERISIRRAGARASCADIGQRLTSSEVFPPTPGPADSSNSGFGALTISPGGARLPGPILARSLLARLMDCGAGGRIAQEAPVQLTRTVWDPVLASWDVSARCVHPRDCVPFLVRVPGEGPSAEAALESSSSSKVLLAPIREKPTVRAGDSVTLLWDQDGIRLTVPAICLDTGAEGQRVRVRIMSGGRTLPAIVVSPGILRAAS
jgi:hypothetical protein